MTKNTSKLCLGTVQFGLEYGVANTTGKVRGAEARAIIELAYKNGISYLDTAIAYGDSESSLGDIGLVGWNVVSKLPPIPNGITDVSGWVKSQLSNSIRRLGTHHLYGLLLHRPDQLLEVSRGDLLYSALLDLKELGLVSKIGVSIYSPNELDELNSHFKFDIIQVPISLIDNRIISSGWLYRLKDNNVEVHVRSIFLQGLLLMPPDTRPRRFEQWELLWKEYDSWIEETGMTRVEACLRHVNSYPEIDKIVIGIDNILQLSEIIQESSKRPILAPKFKEAAAEELLNPSRWHQH